MCAHAARRAVVGVVRPPNLPLQQKDRRSSVCSDLRSTQAQTRRSGACTQYNHLKLICQRFGKCLKVRVICYLTVGHCSNIETGLFEIWTLLKFQNLTTVQKLYYLVLKIDQCTHIRQHVSKL